MDQVHVIPHNALVEGLSARRVAEMPLWVIGSETS